ncbi:hypothetical protein [Polymorphobacter sp.]|uniref:hypothetical protein n=1 Tax=Polymorphobacter sp. TaxID=1909290 RepID=UPI003F72B481
MNRAEALALISAYGADAARWPADARSAVLALAATDAEVAVALDEARRLDALLQGWAGDVPARRFDAEALIPAPAVQPRARGWVKRSWLGGGAIAASVVAALLLTVPVQGPVQGPQQQTVSTEVSLGSASGQAESMDDFAMIFTPTADEEDLI